MTDEPFDLRLRLLDSQVVDPDGRLVCKVDDVEFGQAADGSYVVTALLSGPLALGPRLPGRLGRWVIGLARRWSSTRDDEPKRIPFERVADIGSAVTLDCPRGQLGLAPLEDWLREHVVDRIPGGKHASE